MEEEKKAFVQKLLQEGATRLAVKSACIGADMSLQEPVCTTI